MKEIDMRSFNRTVLIGNVGGEPVLRHTQTGKAVVNLRLATHRRRKDQDDVTTWHRIVLWDRLAELAQQYDKRGQPLYIEGPTTQREWTDGDGVERTFSEVTAREMIFLDQPAKGDDAPSIENIAGKAISGEELEEVVAELAN